MYMLIVLRVPFTQNSGTLLLKILNLDLRISWGQRQTEFLGGVRSHGNHFRRMLKIVAKRLTVFRGGRRNREIRSQSTPSMRQKEGGDQYQRIQEIGCSPGQIFSVHSKIFKHSVMSGRGRTPGETVELARKPLVLIFGGCRLRFYWAAK